MAAIGLTKKCLVFKKSGHFYFKYLGEPEECLQIIASFSSFKTLVVTIVKSILHHIHLGKTGLFSIFLDILGYSF